MISVLIEFLPLHRAYSTVTFGVHPQALRFNGHYIPDAPGVRLMLEQEVCSAIRFAGNKTLVAVRHLHWTEIIKWRGQPMDHAAIERIAQLPQYHEHLPVITPAPIKQEVKVA